MKAQIVTQGKKNDQIVEVSKYKVDVMTSPNSLSRTDIKPLDFEMPLTVLASLRRRGSFVSP